MDSRPLAVAGEEAHPDRVSEDRGGWDGATAFGAAAFASLLLAFGCNAGDSTDTTGLPDDGGTAAGGAGAAALGGSPGAGGASASGGATGNGGAAAGGAAPGGPGLLSACLAYVDAYCSRSIECLVDTAYTGRACFASQEYCPDLLFSTGSTRTREGTLACAEAWKTFSCDDFAVGKSPPCATPGTRTAGETCLFHMQCASASCTVGNAPGQCGTCRGLATLDGPCSNTIACPDGQECPGTTCVNSRPMFWMPPSAAGESCSQYTGCLTGYACLKETATLGAPAHCTVPPAAGATCGIDVSSVIPVCADGLGCGAGNICTVPPKAGEPCNGATYQTCDKDASCDTKIGRCVATSPADLPRGEGAPCGQAIGRCVPRTECRNGTCVATDALTLFTDACGP